ncbi:hypothetical protein KP13_32082 (plasmid) [Klebsiella pneumoniae subsp. pneumoniae Kp13]|nr:hypothetical protein KP13_32082 [Klebsiella pneumoniae subsp. pneumoniae Kp13]
MSCKSIQLWKNYECNMLTRKSDGKSLPVWYCQ